MVCGLDGCFLWSSSGDVVALSAKCSRPQRPPEYLINPPSLLTMGFLGTLCVGDPTHGPTHGNKHLLIMIPVWGR